MLGAGLVAGGVGGCSSGGSSATPGHALSWHASGLPAPAGQRAVVRAATWCDGQWVVVGATAESDSRTRPAAWVSPDAHDWQSLTLHPGSDFYTAREIL